MATPETRLFTLSEGRALYYSGASQEINNRLKRSNEWIRYASPIFARHVWTEVPSDEPGAGPVELRYLELRAEVPHRDSRLLAHHDLPLLVDNDNRWGMNEHQLTVLGGLANLRGLPEDASFTPFSELPTTFREGETISPSKLHILPSQDRRISLLPARQLAA